jgi:hypothetical protein
LECDLGQRGRITTEGYEAEMAIPLKQLRFSPSDSKQVWGVDFVRQFPRDRENRISNNPLDRDILCYLCQIRKLEGLADLQASRNLEVIPTLTTTSVQNRSRSLGAWEKPGLDPDAGVDVRWGITQDLYLNATLNPDFRRLRPTRRSSISTIPSACFSPSAEHSFLDGADYFDTFQNLVYTRNIADPDYGLKLTGKSGRHTYGVLTANDQSTSFIMPRSLGSNVTTLTLPARDSGVTGRRKRHQHCPLSPRPI